MDTVLCPHVTNFPEKQRVGVVDGLPRVEGLSQVSIREFGSATANCIAAATAPLSGASNRKTWNNSRQRFSAHHWPCPSHPCLSKVNVARWCSELAAGCTMLQLLLSPASHRPTCCQIAEAPSGSTRASAMSSLKGKSFFRASCAKRQYKMAKPRQAFMT